MTFAALKGEPVPAALPECRNPDHPGSDRHTMVCAEEREDCFVFYCKTCRDVLGVQAIQVKTKAWLRDKSRRELAAQNGLLSAPPPKFRSLNMDAKMRLEFEQSRKSFAPKTKRFDLPRRTA